MKYQTFKLIVIYLTITIRIISSNQRIPIVFGYSLKATSQDLLQLEILYAAIFIEVKQFKNVS